MAFTPMDHAFFKKKHEVMISLMEKILNLLEKEELGLKESHGIAGFILDAIKNVRNDSQLTSFLYTLKGKWPHFSDLYSLHTQQSVKSDESKMISKLESIINHASN